MDLMELVTFLLAFSAPLALYVLYKLVSTWHQETHPESQKKFPEKS